MCSIPDKKRLHLDKVKELQANKSAIASCMGNIQWYQSREYIFWGVFVFFPVRLCIYFLNHRSELAQVWRQDTATIHHQSCQKNCLEIMCVPQYGP